MRKTINIIKNGSKILSIFASLSSLATTAVVTTPIIANTKKSTIKFAKHNKKASSYQKDNKITKDKITITTLPAVAKGLALDADFKANAFYVNRQDVALYREMHDITTRNLLLDKIQKGEYANYPNNFFAPKFSTSLGVKFHSEKARGAFNIDTSIAHNQIDDGKDQFAPEFSIKKAYFNIGHKDQWEVELGVCEGPIETAFTDNKVYFRGSNRGIFGEIRNQLTDANVKLNTRGIKNGSMITLRQPVVKDDKATTDSFLEDPNKVIPPFSQYFFQDTVSGTSSKQPRLSIYTPLMKSNNLEGRIGLSSNLTTNAQDGIFISAAGYLDQIYDCFKIRYSLGGGRSMKSEQSLGYCPASGITGGVAYLSRAFDIGFQSIYNFKSYATNRFDGTLNVVSATDGTKTLETFAGWKHNLDQTRGPWINTLKARFSLGKDRDATLGLYHSFRKTGFTSDSNVAKNEHLFGVSVGFNAPIPTIPFRGGIDISYAQVKNDARLMEYRFRKIETPRMVMICLGMNYAPIKDLDDEEHFDKFNKPFRHESTPVSVV